MGYYLNNDIANADNVKEPIRFSLACNPNFLVFNKIGEKTRGFRTFLKIKVLAVTDKLTALDIKFSKEGTLVYTLTGKRDVKSLNNYSFLLNNNPAIMAENIRACMMNHAYFSSNFDIYISAEQGSENPIRDIINIVPRVSGSEFALSLNEKEIEGYLSVTKYNVTDQTANQNQSCEIALDIYTDTGLLPTDAEDIPQGSQGRYITTLSKNYFGEALWFDINQIPRNTATYSDAFLRAEGWCNTGTVTDLRLAARHCRQGNNQTFYISDTLYMLNGYNHTLEENNLDDYIYNPLQFDRKIRLLTNQPELMIVKGQTQYINFLLAKNRQSVNDTDALKVIVNVYSQSKKFLNEEIIHTQRLSALHIANTFRLNFDRILNEYENAGYLEVYLSHHENQISMSHWFKVMPDYLFEVRDFAFLNRLGGWSSFSFGTHTEKEFKTSSEVVYTTLTPDYNLSTSIETVQRKDVSEQITVQTAPISRDVAEWLKEMCASPVIYELNKEVTGKLFGVEASSDEVLTDQDRERLKKRIARYVIVDEMVIKYNMLDDLFRLEMKYHYSDSFNAHLNSK